MSYKINISNIFKLFDNYFNDSNYLQLYNTLFIDNKYKIKILNNE